MTLRLQLPYPAGPAVLGMLAHIYRATLEDGTPVAIKLVQRPPKNYRTEVLTCTARELEIWSKLDHQNILRLLGLARFQDGIAILSPWMGFESVVSVVKRYPRIDRYLLCKQLVDAVAYLHGKNIVHGDIKGDNVLVDSNWLIKLTNFGFSIPEMGITCFSASNPGVDTARWMAPELIETGERSPKTDVYALGMAMMEIITGRIPFSEIENSMKVIVRVARDAVVPQVEELKTLQGSARPNIMFGALLRCWSFKPDDRATVEEVQGLLAAIGQS